VAYKEQWIATRLQKAERENATVYLQVGWAGRWVGGRMGGWVKLAGGRARGHSWVAGGGQQNLSLCRVLHWSPPCPPYSLQRVPNEVDLPPIVPAPLVKSTPPGDLLKPTSEEQQSLFTCVVPDNRWGGVGWGRGGRLGGGGLQRAWHGAGPCGGCRESREGCLQ